MSKYRVSFRSTAWFATVVEAEDEDSAIDAAYEVVPSLIWGLPSVEKIEDDE